MAHTLGHQTSHDTFKIEIISSNFANHSDIRPEISFKKKTRKFRSMWRLNHMLLNNQRIKEEIKREIKKKTLE